MIKKYWLFIVGGLVVVAALGLAGFFSMQKDTPVAKKPAPVAPSPTPTPDNKTDTYTIADLKVTYQLDPAIKDLYKIQVLSAKEAASVNGTAATDSGDIFVSGKACNTMSGTIPLLAKGKTTDKKVVKTLTDGRTVLEPQVISTLMACIAVADPALNDTALTKAFNDIAASLQSL